MKHKHNSIKLALILCFAIFSASAQNPTSINHLRLWLRADTGLILSGNNVIQWLDLSGNGNDTKVSALVNSPLISPPSSELNNKQVLKFDGLNDYLQIDSMVIEQPSTYFLVWKAYSVLSVAVSGLADNRRNLIDYENSCGVSVGVLAGSSFYYPKPVFNDFIITYTNFAGPLSQLTENCVVKGMSDFGSQGVDGLVVGAFYNYLFPLNGEIAELVVYDTLLSQGEILAAMVLIPEPTTATFAGLLALSGLMLRRRRAAL